VLTIFSSDNSDLVSGHRNTAVPLHVVFLLVAFVVSVGAQGGYYLSGRILVALLVTAGALVAIMSRPRLPGDVRMVLLAGAVLSAWALIRGGAAGGYLSAVPTVLTLGCVVGAVVILAAADPAAKLVCARVLVGVGVLVALTGWLGVAWRVPRWGMVVQGLWRGSATLTYVNATAALLAALAVFAIGYRRQRSDAILADVPACVLLVGLGATVSRAGVLVLLAGLAVLMALSGVATTLRQAVPPFVGASIGFAALLPVLPAGTSARPWLAVGGLLVGVLVTIFLTRLVHHRAVAAFLTLVPLTLATVGAAGGLARPAVMTVAGSRLTLDSFGRTGAARAAVRMVAAHPWIGVGPGRARFFWVDPGGHGFVARYAHDEYLQLLAELGFVGLTILLALLAALILVLARGRRAAPEVPPLWAGTVAAFAVLVVHSGFDFLWQIPAIPLAGGLLVGLACSGTTARVLDHPPLKEEPCGEFR